MQPKAIGPFTFGTIDSYLGRLHGAAGAFSITALRARDADDENGVREMSRQVATELLGMKGFIGFVAATVGDRMLTITAWENPDDPRQVMQGGTHGEAMKRFFGTAQTLGGGGYTAVFVPRAHQHDVGAMPVVPEDGRPRRAERAPARAAPPCPRRSPTGSGSAPACRGSGSVSSSSTPPRAG